MKQLNFFPYYRELLHSGRKTTTFRLSNREGFEPGDEVSITVGWDALSSEHLCRGKIQKVYKKRLRDLQSEDFEGESPDCQDPEATSMVLGAIYRRIVSLDDDIVIVKFSRG